MKKYFQLRICKECDEQRMVNLDGYCSKCVNSHKKSPTIVLSTCDVCGCVIPEDEEHWPHDKDFVVDGPCDCDNVTCEKCCWECNPDPNRPLEEHEFTSWDNDPGLF